MEAMKSILFSILLIMIFIACENNKESPSEGNPDQLLNFESLVAEDNSLNAGESTLIKANATGYQLSYNWSASAGDLLGTGSEVIYAASPCHAGSNEISCTVIDGHNQSQTKSIIIVVF